MITVTGISKQSFLTMGTYLFVILFHSSSLLSAAAAALCVLLVQSAAYVILPFLAGKTERVMITYTAAIFAVITAVLICRLYSFIPLTGISPAFLPFQDPSFVLLLIPLFVDQAKSPQEYSPKAAVKLAALFLAVILPVSFLRELLGFGSIAGVRVTAEGSHPLPLLTHTSGAAFLLLLITILSLYIYRLITGKHQVLDVLDESAASNRQPVLSRREDLDRLYSALLSLLIVIPVLLCLYLLAVFALPSGFAFDLMLVFAVLLQGMAALFLYVITGRNNTYINRFLSLPWLLPVQTFAVVFPFSLPMRNLFLGKGAIGGLAVLVLYIGCSWIFVSCLLLFARSVKRRLLFGKRPEILNGLPLLLLLSGLILMILSGFASIPNNLMIN